MNKYYIKPSNTKINFHYVNSELIHVLYHGKDEKYFLELLSGGAQIKNEGWSCFHEVLLSFKNTIDKNLPSIDRASKIARAILNKDSSLCYHLDYRGKTAFERIDGVLKQTNPKFYQNTEQIKNEIKLLKTDYINLK